MVKNMAKRLKSAKVVQDLFQNGTKAASSKKSKQSDKKYTLREQG
jgi:hypothetical protein